MSFLVPHQISARSWESGFPTAGGTRRLPSTGACRQAGVNAAGPVVRGSRSTNAMQVGPKTAVGICGPWCGRRMEAVLFPGGNQRVQRSAAVANQLT